MDERREGGGEGSVLGWGNGKAKESPAVGSQCNPKVPHPHPSLLALEQLYPVERKVVNGPDSNERIAYMGYKVEESGERNDKEGGGAIRDQ